MNSPKHFIPNKIVLFVTSLVVIGLMSYGVYHHFKDEDLDQKEKENTVNVSFVEEEENLSKSYFLDSDNDGAYDWVEDLWPELDPQNPDSDGDGVLDGRYIEQKKRIREKDRREQDLSYSKLTESEKLGRGLYTALLAVEQAGGEIDEETKEKVSENVADYIQNLPLGTRVFIRDELTLVEDTKENSHLYREKMMNFFEQYPVNTSEISLIIEATENPEKFRAQLQTAIIKYETYIDLLSEMEVPYAIAGRHTELLNAAGQIEGGLKNLVQEDQDDIVALSSLIQIEKTMATFIDANSHIEKYFDIISDETIFSDYIPSLPFSED